MSFIIMAAQSFADESNLENFTYPLHTCGEKLKNQINLQDMQHMKM